MVEGAPAVGVPRVHLRLPVQQALDAAPAAREDLYIRGNTTKTSIIKGNLWVYVLLSLLKNSFYNGAYGKHVFKALLEVFKGPFTRGFSTFKANKLAKNVFFVIKNYILRYKYIKNFACGGLFMPITHTDKHNV